MWFPLIALKRQATFIFTPDYYSDAIAVETEIGDRYLYKLILNSQDTEYEIAIAIKVDQIIPVFDTDYELGSAYLLPKLILAASDTEYEVAIAEVPTKQMFNGQDSDYEVSNSLLLPKLIMTASDSDYETTNLILLRQLFNTVDTDYSWCSAYLLPKLILTAVDTDYQQVTII